MLPYNVLQTHLKRGCLANGYLLVGKTDIPAFADYLKKYGEVRSFIDDVGINEAREINEKSALTFSPSKKLFFILNAGKMSRFVPQAVLKTIEDSLPDRHFFILSDRPDSIPNTLRSRLVELYFNNQPVSNNFSSFIKADFASRIKIVDELAEDKEKFIGFLDDMERAMLDGNRHDFIPKIRQVRESASVFNVSRKMCLEYLTHLLE